MKKLRWLPLVLAFVLVGCSSEETVFEPVSVSGFEVEMTLEHALTSVAFDSQGLPVEGERLGEDEILDLLTELEVDLPEIPEAEFIFQLELISYEIEEEVVDELDLMFLTPAVDYLFLNRETPAAQFEDLTFTVPGIFVYEITQDLTIEGDAWLLDEARVLVTVTVSQDPETEELVANVQYEGEAVFTNGFIYDASDLISNALEGLLEEPSELEEASGENQTGGGSGTSAQVQANPGGSGIPEDSAITLSTSEALSYLALVNRHFRLASSFSPGDLSVVNVQSMSGTHHLRQTAARAAESLFQEAAESGHTLVATSGYRSFATQQATHNHWISTLGEVEARRVSARPGHSEHQLGLALDITTPALGGLSTQFSSTPEGTWVRNNAHRFGFIIRYPAGREADTGYIYEPWHIRYVGVSAATTIHNGNLILEDFLR